MSAGDERARRRRDTEAVLLVADSPVGAEALAASVGGSTGDMEALLEELAGEYERQERGFVLRPVAGGWRLYSHPDARPAVEAHVRSGQHARLSQAALETLAIVAYQQPVARQQVAAIRGVDVDAVFRTLVTRGLIEEVGHDQGAGQATLYGTTSAFLEQLGLSGLHELPPLAEYLPEGIDLTEPGGL